MLVTAGGDCGCRRAVIEPLVLFKRTTIGYISELAAGGNGWSGKGAQ